MKVFLENKYIFAHALLNNGKFKIENNDLNNGEQQSVSDILLNLTPNWT